MYNIEIKILWKLRYCAVKKYHTDHTDKTFVYTVNSLPMILVSRNNPSFVCRCQYNEIYFCELFLTAHFSRISRKFEKPSDKVPTVHFLLSNDIAHFATYLIVKQYSYSIYVIMYVHGNQLTQTTDNGQQRRHTLNLSYYLTERLTAFRTRILVDLHTTRLARSALSHQLMAKFRKTKGLFAPTYDQCWQYYYHWCMYKFLLVTNFWGH